MELLCHHLCVAYVKVRELVKHAGVSNREIDGVSMAHGQGAVP